MKCIEIIRMVAEDKLRLSHKGASPASVAAPILEDLSRYRKFLAALRDGEASVESRWGIGVRAVRIACPEVLRSGRCLGCICCKEWSAWTVHTEGQYEGLSGLCLSREIKKNGRIGGLG